MARIENDRQQKGSRGSLFMSLAYCL
jgi:hypothetical protein